MPSCAPTRRRTRPPRRANAASRTRAEADPGPQKRHSSQRRIDGFAFEGEDGKDAFVEAAEGLAGDETAERFVAEGEFAQRQPALGAKAADAQAREMVRRVILRAVDDAQIF